MCENRNCLYVKAFQSYCITACECMHLVRRGHFPSRDKDGGHTTGSAIPENFMLHANLMALSFIEPELWAIEVYIAGIGSFDLFCSCALDLDPMTFIYELDAYSLEIHRMCIHELPTSRLAIVIV